MDIIEFRGYCLSFPFAHECLPFDEDTLVYKVGGKMFAMAGMHDFRFFNVKCRPEVAVELRERYREVEPAFHCNKKHWNSVFTDGELSEEFMRRQIADSYDLVFSALTAAEKKRLENR